MKNAVNSKKNLRKLSHVSRHYRWAIMTDQQANDSTTTHCKENLTRTNLENAIIVNPLHFLLSLWLVYLLYYPSFSTAFASRFHFQYQQALAIFIFSFTNIFFIIYFFEHPYFDLNFRKNQTLICGQITLAYNSLYHDGLVRVIVRTDCFQNTFYSLQFIQAYTSAYEWWFKD